MANEYPSNQNHQEVIKILWDGNQHCMARSICGILTTKSFVVTPKIAEDLIKFREDSFTFYQGPDENVTLTSEVKVFNDVIEHANLMLNTKALKPIQPIETVSIEELLLAKKDGELVAFIEQLGRHVTHIGDELGYDPSKKDYFVANSYERVFLQYLKSAFSEKKINTYIIELLRN